jgi:thiol-disulfide isomerase/thioredoxin
MRIERGAMGRMGAIALASVILLAAPPAARAQVRVGDAFPALQGAGLVGQALPATAGKVVLVDFWASWCAPCRQSFPAFGRINSEFAAKGLVILAISVDQDPAGYDSFVRALAPSFFVALDKTQRLVGDVRVPAMPTSYLVDRAGRVRFIHPGFRGAETENALRAEIATLTSEPAPSYRDGAGQSNP